MMVMMLVNSFAGAAPMVDNGSVEGSMGMMPGDSVEVRGEKVCIPFSERLYFVAVIVIILVKSQGGKLIENKDYGERALRVAIRIMMLILLLSGGTGAIVASGDIGDNTKIIRGNFDPKLMLIPLLILIWIQKFDHSSQENISHLKLILKR